LRYLGYILGPDRLVAAGTLGTALSLLLLGFARHSALGLAAYMIAGISSIAVLASLNVSVQVSLPDADIVRGGFHFISTRDVFP
jgi:Transmembrane secretion effector